MKKIGVLLFISFFFFAPKALAFEIIPDIGDSYQTEDQITIKNSPILGRPSYVTEKYDSTTRIKKRLYRYNIVTDMLLDAGKLYYAGDGISLSISNTFERTSSSEKLITNSMTSSISTSFSSEIGVEGIGKTEVSSSISNTFGSSYSIAESNSITQSKTVTYIVSENSKGGYYRLETRTKCVVYYVVEYLYNSPSKCWLQNSYYVFDASDNYYIKLTRYQMVGNKLIYDDSKDANCFYLSFSYL